jgi:hypothetical protein
MTAPASSWRTTITGIVNIVVGAGLIAFAGIGLTAPTATQAAIAAAGLGLLTAGVQGLMARDQKAHDEDRAQGPS